MKPSGAIRYPVKGLTLQRVNVGQRSQGDGEEQANIALTSTQDILSSECGQISPTGNQNKQICSTQPEELVSKNDDIARNSSSTIRVYEKSLNEKYLPDINDIAQKLTKVSIMSSPDSQLLNTPPKDINSRITYRLHPSKSPSQISRVDTYNLQSQKRKEPRFVPYEPYKGCIKPIEIKKKLRKALPVTSSGVIEEQIQVDESQIVEKDHQKTERLSLAVEEFEKERSTWEDKKKSLESENRSLKEQLNQMKKEKSNLESQLKVQSQVNTELKKLLVASVGEDVQGKVQCLTEDKARMATMIRRYSEKVDKDYEEKERMGIQCDVWRSKFLGSSMLVDELAGSKAVLMQRVDEAQEAMRILMDEHELARQHILNTFKMNKQLREAFDPLAVTSGGIPPLTSADLVTLAVDGSLLAQTVRDHLCGPLGRSLGCDLSLDGLESKTPGEKMGQQVLGHICSHSGMKSLEYGTLSPGTAAMRQRFHPNARFEHITVNCCGHCNGDIKVI